MSARLPTCYRVDGLPYGTLLCFRTTDEPDGRTLLSLIPDAEEQHPLDVVSIFLDDPRLQAVDVEGEPFPAAAQLQLELEQTRVRLGRLAAAAHGYNESEITAADFETEIKNARSFLRTFPSVFEGQPARAARFDLLEPIEAFQVLEAENARLREVFQDFADPRNWAVERQFAEPRHVWIGSLRKHPSEIAKEALASRAGEPEDRQPTTRAEA